MAKVVKKSKKSQVQEKLHLSLTTKNFIIIGIGILSIVIGYVFMSQNSVDGFLPTVIAPILLVLGYCVIVPIGILYKDKTKEPEEEEKIPVSMGTSNVKTK